MVTNDDGVGAPGINATVKALAALPDTKVTVVAPLTNQSGTGAKVTPGTLTVTNATTASGYPAKAVAGYPADTIIWAIDDHGIAQRPDLVVSGINFGENIGPLAGSLRDRWCGRDCSGPWHPRPRRQPRGRQRPAS